MDKKPLFFIRAFRDTAGGMIPQYDPNQFLLFESKKLAEEYLENTTNLDDAKIQAAIRELPAIASGIWFLRIIEKEEG